MKRFEAEQVRDQVQRTTGAVLSEASSARTARMLTAVSATLDRYAGDSLFDTEPALLSTTLGSLRNGSKSR